jgi:hypothetical protein
MFPLNNLELVRTSILHTALKGKGVLDWKRKYTIFFIFCQQYLTHENLGDDGFLGYSAV